MVTMVFFLLIGVNLGGNVEGFTRIEGIPLCQRKLTSKGAVFMKMPIWMPGRWKATDEISL